MSSMSFIRSVARFTAPLYSSLPWALSTKDWKIPLACVRDAMVLSLSPPDFALYSWVRIPSL